MLQDGIEIHFDKKRCHLELSCEPDAFTAYRNLVENDLKNFPEIPFENVIEIRITNTAAVIKRGTSTQKWVINLALCFIVIFTLAFAFIGVYTIFTRHLN